MAYCGVVPVLATAWNFMELPRRAAVDVRTHAQSRTEFFRAMTVHEFLWFEDRLVLEVLVDMSTTKCHPLLGPNPNLLTARCYALLNFSIA